MRDSAQAAKSRRRVAVVGLLAGLLAAVTMVVHDVEAIEAGQALYARSAAGVHEMSPWLELGVALLLIGFCSFALGRLMNERRAAAAALSRGRGARSGR